MAKLNVFESHPANKVLELPSMPVLPTVGSIFALIGLLLRSFARWLAWPEEFKYSGDRANTIWAYRESLFADLGLVALVFGLALVFLAIARTNPHTHAEPSAAPDPHH
jgi:hypothetical protein